MAFYKDTQTMCQVMSELFQNVMASSSAVRTMSRTGLVVRLITTDPTLSVTVDGRSQPTRFTCAENDVSADLVLHMPADVLHQVWLSEIRLRDAYWRGLIRVEGSVWRAFSLIGLFRQAEMLYPQILVRQGLLPTA
jgi:hypothetical protein